MADPIKNYYLNQYTDATSGLNQPVTMTDSPIYQAGVKNWDPTSFGSLLGQAMIPAQNLYSKATGSDNVLYGKAGLGSGAAFKQLPKDATGIETLKFADTFGHEMSHLGWDYKPRGERINVPGVRKEGSKLSATLGSSLGGYKGEEQWNYMHDLMYGPKSYSIDSYKKDLTNLKNQFSSGTITPDQYIAEGKALGEKLQDLSGHLTPGEGYLTKHGLINKGDLSYTPKAYNEIAWSGLTTPSKRAIGFGINPFEDTRGAGQWYKQQKYKKMSQAKKRAAMQQRIRQAEAAEAAKQKTTPAYTGPVARDFDPKQDTGRRPDKPGGFTDPGKGSYGPWMANGGIVDLYRYGGF